MFDHLSDNYHIERCGPPKVPTDHPAVAAVARVRTGILCREQLLALGWHDSEIDRGMIGC
jgi:hypothetical protein